MKLSRVPWLGFLLAALIVLAVVATMKRESHSTEAVSTPFTTAYVSADGSTITATYTAATCTPFDHSVVKPEGEVIQLSIYLRATGRPCAAAATNQSVDIPLDKPHPHAQVIQGP